MTIQAIGRLDADSMESIRRWAAQAGELLVEHAPLAKEARLIAVDAFAQALGVNAEKTTDQHLETVRALTEIADDGVLGPESVDLTLPAVWGPPVTEGEREQAESENLRRAFLARQDVLVKSVSRTAVAQLLGLSEQAVTKRLDRGQMVGLKVKGQWAIPTWQLDPDSQDGLLPGIAELTAQFSGGPVALTRWVLQPSPDLAGRPPRDVLASNHVSEVVHAALSSTAAGW